MTRRILIALWVLDAAISLAWYGDAHWGIRRLGGKRISLDFWRFAILLEYYE